MDPKGEQSHSEQDNIYPQQTNNEQEQPDPQEETATKILQNEQQEQKNSNKSIILSQDIEIKLEQLLEDIHDDEGNNFQSIITLRMKELAYNKILVLTYQKSYFRLVHAHFHIAKQYLKYKCYEQALVHLDQAITKNVKAASSLINKLYHSYLLTHLGICYFHTNKFDQSLVELAKAINLQYQYEDSERKTTQNFQTLIYFAKVKAQLKHPNALEYMKSVSERAQKFYESNGGHTYGTILYQYGKLELSFNNTQAAIKLYEKAIEIIKMSNSLRHQEEIIKIYQQLADIYESIDPVRYLTILKSKYQVFQDTYGNADKKSIKEQRNYATALLKHKKIEEAIDQFDDILQKQQKIYGQNSLQVGKQYKTIANIYIAKHDTKQAESNFKKAMKIFHDLGDQRLARQVRMKISSLQMHQ